MEGIGAHSDTNECGWGGEGGPRRAGGVLAAAWFSEV